MTRNLVLSKRDFSANSILRIDAGRRELSLRQIQELFYLRELIVSSGPRSEPKTDKSHFSWRAIVGQASSSAKHKHCEFSISCNRCWQRQARLRKMHNHSCNTDLVQESKKVSCFVNFAHDAHPLAQSFHHSLVPG